MVTGCPITDYINKLTHISHDGEIGLELDRFDYHLPRDMIAQRKSSPRDASRLFRLDVSTDPPRYDHLRFRDLGRILRKGDILILNRSRVIPARVKARKGTGGKAEVLFLRKHEKGYWEALIGGKRIKEGDTLRSDDGAGIRIIRKVDEGKCIVEVVKDGRSLEGGELMEWMKKAGRMPTPPYIRRELRDPEEYQTIYSREEGSVAAPTAGLHFTDELLETLKKKGVMIRYITLHVGLGTFAPVKSDNVEDHNMEEEWYRIPDDTIKSIESAVKDHKNGGARRILPVGTTVMRTLETGFDQGGRLMKKEGFSGIFIRPGHVFSLPYAGFITNFHLPRSTPLMLVSAFFDLDGVLEAYEEAKRVGYGFYSLGDSMMIDRRGEG